MWSLMWHIYRRVIYTVFVKSAEGSWVRDNSSVYVLSALFCKVRDGVFVWCVMMFEKGLWGMWRKCNAKENKLKNTVNWKMQREKQQQHLRCEIFGCRDVGYADECRMGEFAV